MNPRMFGGLSLTRIIEGLSKTLGMVNKAIPLYQQVKPILSNAGNLNNILNMIQKDDNTSNNESKKPILEQKKVSNNNLPTFFQ